MKKFLISISFLICAVACFSQWTIQTIGGPKTFVVARGPIGSDSTIVFRGSFDDTSAANNGQIETLAGAVIRVSNELWMRNSTATEWLPIGGQAVSVDNSNTIQLGGTGGTEDPILANLIISSQADNILQQFADGAYVKNTIPNGIISGGFRTWVSGYTYDITQTVYAIGGVVLTAPETQLTLANADPSLNRLDYIVANSNQTITAITGTPATDPALPSYDPLTQVPLGFVLVTAGTTQPTGVQQDYIYLNNAEWTTSSSTPRIDPNSTNNPFSPTKTIEFTLARNNDSITFTDPTQPTNMANFQFLTMKLRSKATWGVNSRLTFRFFNDGVAQGNLVSLGNGNFGFNSGNTASYQTLTIQKELFGNLTNVDLLFITVVTAGGGTIGLYLDDIQLQGGTGTGEPTTGNFWIVGGNLMGASLIGGTLDNYPVQIVSNNTNHTQFLTSGSTLMQGTNPALSFLLGTLNTNDYYIRRNGTTLLLHSAGEITEQISGNNTYTYNQADGHTWYATAGTQRMRLNASGNLGLGTVSPSATTIFDVVSTTKSSHFAPTMTSTEMTNILTPKTGSAVFNSTANLHYWYNGSAWVPMGGLITADNGLTMSTATNVQLGGALLAHTTVDGGANKMIFTSTTAPADSGTVVIRNTGAGLGAGLYVATTSGIGILVNSATGNSAAVIATSSAGQALTGVATTTGTALVASSSQSRAASLSTSPSGTNDVVTMVDFGRQSSGGVGANGIGMSLNFTVEASSLTDTTNQIITKWSDATSATRTSQFIITGVNSATTNDLIYFDGNGGVRIPGTGTPTNTLQAINTTSTAVKGETTSGNAVFGVATTGVGGQFNTTSGAAAIQGFSTTALAANFSNTPSSTNTIEPVARMNRGSTGTPANNIGGSLELGVSTTTTNNQFSNSIVWKWTDATHATRTSQFIIRGVNSAVTSDLFTLSGTGALQLNKYGINTFAGVAAYVLGVDASGNVVEVAAAGAGMTNVLTTTGDIIYSSSGTTPARLGIGTNGQVLTVSGGVPVWSTIVGTGSVTDVSWTGGIVSIATSTTTPAFTIAGTSGGIPYFSSSSTWASSAALAANAIVIGGGAGAAPSTTTTGTGVLTALGVNVGSAGAFVVNGGALGTPSSGTLTNATGLPVSTGISGLGTNVATALAVNVGSAGAFITFNGAGGTPSSLTLTNATGLPLTTGVTGALDETNGGTGITSYSTGDIIYASASNTLSKLTAGTNGHVLTLSGGVPTWAAAGAGTVTSVAMSVPSFLSVSGSPITGAGTFAVTLSGTALPIANGGTGLTADGAANEILGVEADGSGLEYKAFTGSNGINVTHSVGGVAISNTFNPTVQTLTDGATITWNVTNGGNSKVTLAGTGRTLSITNPVAGYTYTIEITQGSGGSKTITTWPTGTTWSGPNTLSTIAGDVDVVVFYYNGTGYRAVMTTDYN